MDTNGSKREEEDEEREVERRLEECKEKIVYMWGYLPGVSSEKSPILSPVTVKLPDGDSWNDVCGGGCGFALAISGLLDFTSLS